MNIGVSEAIAILSLLGGCFAWLNSALQNLDKRLDRMERDINGIGSRTSLLEGGTCEILTEQINQLRTKLFDLENKLE